MNNKIISRNIIITGILFLGTASLSHAHCGVCGPDQKHEASKNVRIHSEVSASVLQHYLHIQQSLAGDDFEKAKKFASVLSTSLSKKDTAHLSEKSIGAINAIAKAEDIKAARKAFLTLSNEMIGLVKKHGAAEDKSLYQVYCPMAFGNKGASWIQDSKEVVNPYYGSMMFRCGSVKEQLTGKAKNANEHSSQGQHQH